MNPALIGLGMLVAGAALVVVALAATLLAVLRVRRRMLALQATLREVRRDAEATLIALREQRAETRALLLPWRRLVRWARHPLVVATLEWYGRRRRVAHP